MAIGDCSFYTDINAGATLTAVKNSAYFTDLNAGATLAAVGNTTYATDINAGATLTASQDTTILSVVNAGIAPPVSQTIVHGAQGWGVLPTGSQSATVLIESSNATGYNYEGDVTA